MRLMNQRLTWAIAVMAGFVAQSASAQVQRTSYFGGPECAAPAACANGECANDECSNDDCSNSDDGCGLGDPWTLMGALGCRGKCLAEKGWFLKGFSAWGYQSDPDGAFAGNGNVLDDREFNNFAINQQYFMFGKTASYDGSRLGFQADVIYGWDGNEAQSFSNPAGTYDFLNGFDHGAYEWAIPQLYADFAVTEKLSIKGGHFYTIVGYEVIPATGNFFLSRQLTFYNSEPFTHTGVLATYVANDKWTFWNGWTLGMDTGFQQNAAGGNSYLSGFTWAMNDTTTLIVTSIVGNLGARTPFGDGGIGSAILTKKWGCEGKLQTVHQFDILETDLAASGFNLSNGGTGVAGDSIGFINYAFYEHGPRLKSGVRAEWYKADGTSYYTLTGGVNVRPHANLVIRPEIRGMWAPGDQGNTGALVGTNTSGFIGNLYNQTVFGVDAIVTF